LKAFREAIRTSDYVLTADLPLRAATTVDDIERDVDRLAAVVDAVQVVDDREAVGHMSSLAASQFVLRRGLDALLHMSCRDRNRVALQADLRGAAAIGVTTLVLARGEKLSREGYIRGKSVFDTNEQRLVRIAREIGEQSVATAPDGFLLGTIVTAFAPGEDWQADRINQSVAAGARFLQTQPCLNSGVLGKYLEMLVRRRVTHRASLIVEIPLLASAEQARLYKAKNPSALIPDAVVQRIVKARDPRAEGIAVCAEQLAALRSTPGVSGVNIRDAGSTADVVEIVRLSGVRV